MQRELMGVGNKTNHVSDVPDEGSSELQQPPPVPIMLDVKKLSSLRAFGKTDISEATVGVRRPTSTTFEDLFKGYNIVVYMKIRIQREEGQNNPTRKQQCRSVQYWSGSVCLVRFSADGSASCVLMVRVCGLFYVFYQLN